MGPRVMTTLSDRAIEARTTVLQYWQAAQTGLGIWDPLQLLVHRELRKPSVRFELIAASIADAAMLELLHAFQESATSTSDLVDEYLEAIRDAKPVSLLGMDDDPFLAVLSPQIRLAISKASAPELRRATGAVLRLLPQNTRSGPLHTVINWLDTGGRSGTERRRLIRDSDSSAEQVLGIDRDVRLALSFALDEDASYALTRCSFHVVLARNLDDHGLEAAVRGALNPL
jgi:hypothetical protein